MPGKSFDARELELISVKTIGHYQDRAEDFWLGTRDHDVSQNVETLLRYLSVPAPAKILDLGCGPGRDLITFKEQGHSPVGLDGSEAFCEMARKISGQEVLHQDFIALSLEPDFYDGVFANATLFHIPMCEIERVLGELFTALRSGGVLFCSNPRGPNIEQVNGERYGAYYELENWRLLLEAAGFTELTHYYRPPGVPREEQPWLASAWRKPLT
jgi:SAM-dependent methyltransferase